MDKLMYAVPQPALALLHQARNVFTADQKNLQNKDVKNALRVSFYALSRIAIAVALYKAIDKYKPDVRIATGAAAALSVPATIMYWGGKVVSYGIDTIRDNWVRPSFTRTYLTSASFYNVLKGTGVLFTGFYVLDSHNALTGKFRGGLLEWIMTKGVEPGKYRGQLY